MSVQSIREFYLPSILSDQVFMNMVVKMFNFCAKCHLFRNFVSFTIDWYVLGIAVNIDSVVN